MTAVEVFELTTSGGASDFVRVIELCSRLGPYCLIGGLAVNCFVDPVYTLDADLVLVSDAVDDAANVLADAGFTIQRFPHSLNAQAKPSELRIQFTLDERYQAFVSRSTEREVLGTRVQVAQLEDIVQGKLWAWGDPARRLAKRKKDELDLIRLAEAYPELVSTYPPVLRDLLAG